MTATFIGLDLETTGLDSDCQPLELGMIAYDSRLVEIDTFHALILADTFTKLYTQAAPVARSMHHANGLWDDLAQLAEDPEVTSGAVVSAVEHRAISWMDRQCGETALFMLGTNIEYDRGVLGRTMPALLRRFHYQSVDANSFKLIARHSYNASLQTAGVHRPAHRVLPDIRSSVELITTSLTAMFDATTTGSIGSADQ